MRLYERRYDSGSAFVIITIFFVFFFRIIAPKGVNWFLDRGTKFTRFFSRKRKIVKYLGALSCDGIVLKLRLDYFRIFWTQKPEIDSTRATRIEKLVRFHSWLLVLNGRFHRVWWNVLKSSVCCRSRWRVGWTTDSFKTEMLRGASLKFWSRKK